MTPSVNREWNPNPRYGSTNNSYYNNVGSSAYMKGDTSAMEPSRPTTSSRDEASVSISNASDIESEWIEEDEPGVYITIRQLVDGTRELRRVRFRYYYTVDLLIITHEFRDLFIYLFIYFCNICSRERFGEVNAKQWWESNKDRIQAQYLS